MCFDVCFLNNQTVASVDLQDLCILYLKHFSDDLFWFSYCFWLMNLSLLKHETTNISTFILEVRDAAHPSIPFG